MKTAAQFREENERLFAETQKLIEKIERRQRETEEYLASGKWVKPFYRALPWLKRIGFFSKEEVDELYRLREEFLSSTDEQH